MIYTISKNRYSRTLIVEPGDLEIKKKLWNYRRRGWQISAKIGSASEKIKGERPSQDIKLGCQALNRPPVAQDRTGGKSRMVKVLGYWREIE